MDSAMKPTTAIRTVLACLAAAWLAGLAVDARAEALAPPKLELAAGVVHFGEVVKGKKPAARVAMRNIGDEELVIEKAKAG